MTIKVVGGGKWVSTLSRMNQRFLLKSFEYNLMYDILSTKIFNIRILFSHGNIYIPFKNCELEDLLYFVDIRVFERILLRFYIGWRDAMLNRLKQTTIRNRPKWTLNRLKQTTIRNRPKWTLTRLKQITIRNRPKWTIFANGGFGLLEMV